MTGFVMREECSIIQSASCGKWKPQLIMPRVDLKMYEIWKTHAWSCLIRIGKCIIAIVISKTFSSWTAAKLIL